MVVKKPKNRSSTLIYKMFNLMWALIGLNSMIISFGFHSNYKWVLIPTIFILLSIALTISGFILKFVDLWLSGILINISAFIVIMFQLNYLNQLLYMSAMSFFGIFLPGICLNIRNNKQS